MKHHFEMKLWLILTLLLMLRFAICHTEGDDIKVLRDVKIFDIDAIREETFSLNNENTKEKELTIRGTQTVTLPHKNNPMIKYRLAVIYVADKNGYRAKYELVRESDVLPAAVPPVLSLNAQTLKGLTG